MYYDFLVSFICLLLAISFYRGKLDWIIIWYGCASQKQKDKMPGQRVMRIAWITMLILSAWMCLAGVLGLYMQPALADVFRVLGTIFFLLSCWYNYSICYDKLRVKELF